MIKSFFKFIFYTFVIVFGLIVFLGYMAVEETSSGGATTSSASKPAKAERVDTGSWSYGFYVDEFGDRTTDGYVKNTQRNFASFSNSATTDSKLKVEMLMSVNRSAKNPIGDPFFRLYEYGGKNPVKGTYSDSYDNGLDCKARPDNGGNDFDFMMTQGQGGDSFRSSGYGAMKMKEAIEAEIGLSLFCTSRYSKSTKYRFDLIFSKYKVALAELEGAGG
ncbi:hypothetical protein N9V97_00875 [Luminiphilus sp.]|nr:hypothetical protein [Luminiphilus sp.]